MHARVGLDHGDQFSGTDGSESLAALRTDAVLGHAHFVDE